MTIMQGMNDKHITRLEAQLEQLVEGVFTGLFRRHINAHDIALKLARGMESSLRAAQENDPRPIAPDKYLIALNPEIQKRLQHHRPDLVQALASHLVELAADAGYRMLHPPTLVFLASPDLPPSAALVKAEHTDTTLHGTAAMQALHIAEASQTPLNPQLIINGDRVEPITQAVINIGRSSQNDIVIDDPYISRHHLQLRLRFGAYTLFDVESKSGTLVNNVNVTEHRLRSGDVIQIGGTKIVYLSDDTNEPYNPDLTDTFNSVDLA